MELTRNNWSSIPHGTNLFLLLTSKYFPHEYLLVRQKGISIYHLYDSMIFYLFGGNSHKRWKSYNEQKKKDGKKLVDYKKPWPDLPNKPDDWVSYALFCVDKKKSLNTQWWKKKFSCFLCIYYSEKKKKNWTNTNKQKNI